MGILAAPYVNAHNVVKCVYCCDGCDTGPGVPLMEQQHWTFMLSNCVGHSLGSLSNVIWDFSTI